MFITEHIQGKLVYETEKVVYIHVFLKPQYTTNCDSNVYITQLLISLVNMNYSCVDTSIKNSHIYLSENMLKEEIAEGVSKYLEMRKMLEI